MVFEVCASGLECEGCGRARNECVEAIENAGDARREFSKWGSYFIGGYNVKIT